MKASVIVFPGSNCDRDVAVCLTQISGAKTNMVWHTETSLPPTDVIILPGGFSYGDYLRGGAMAANSPIMREVIAQAEKNTPILGICNGFQVLTECGLLPGALMRNRNLHFVCRNTRLIVERATAPFLAHYKQGSEIVIPVAHNEGNYFADDETLKKLEGENRIALRYAGDDNPNGACLDIAAIVNEKGNVLGMMPHPERCAESVLADSTTDGKALFEGLAAYLT